MTKIVRTQITRVNADGDEEDVWIAAHIDSDRVVSPYVRDDDHGAYELTPDEMDRILHQLEMQDR